MNIVNQIYVTNHLKKYFESDIFKYSGLKKYSENNLPMFMYGYTSKDLEIIKNNKSYCVIIWTGGDCDVRNKAVRKKLEILKKYKNVYHVAISNFIEESLNKHNIKYISCPFYVFNINIYSPIKKGNCIYVYCSVHDKEAYGYSTIIKIEKMFPKIKFFYCTNSVFYDKFRDSKFKCYSRKELIDIYKKCFLGIRLTKHDGLAATVQELGCMGIKTIWNGNTPSALNYNTLDDIVLHIKNESKTIGKIDVELSKKVKDFLSIKKNMLNIYSKLNVQHK